MPFVESPHSPTNWNCASDALAEIRAYPSEMHILVLEIFDQLDELTQEFLVHQLARGQADQEAERELFEEQIEYLAAATSELAKTVTEQRLLLSRSKGNRAP
jgi:hypothetical protein